MQDHQGKYQVINIDLKPAKGVNFENTLEKVYKCMIKALSKYEYLADDNDNKLY